MAYDAFLYFDKADAIEGETQDDEFKKETASEIYSFSFGLSNPTTIGSQSGGAGAGKASFSSLNVMKKVDAGSIKLANMCATGTHAKSATLVLRKSGGKAALKYIVYTLENVFVDSIQVSGSSGGDDSPTESLSLAFGKVKVEYTKQKPDGSADGGAKTFTWNLQTNKDV